MGAGAGGTDAEAICLRARALRSASGTLTDATFDEMPTTVTEHYSVPVDVATVRGTDEQTHIGLHPHPSGAGVRTVGFDLVEPGLVDILRRRSISTDREAGVYGVVGQPR